jgi:hypothetical protein
MRRISPIGWLLVLVGVILVVVGVIYATSSPPNLPGFLPGAVAHPIPHHVYKHKFTKRAGASFVVAVIAFVGAYYASARGR